MATSTTLSVLQENFCQQYLIDLNATAAYKRAGYRAKNDNVAGASAAVLLKMPKIQARLTELRQSQIQRTQITADRVLQELVLLGYSDIGQILDFSGPEPKLRPCSEIPEAARRAIAAVKVKRYTEGRGDSAREVEITEFRLWPKDSALEKLGRHLALFTDVTEHKGTVQFDGPTLTPEQRRAELARLCAAALQRSGVAASPDAPERPDPGRNGTCHP